MAYCPNCGRKLEEVLDGGFNKDGSLFCCKGCAEDTGCTCS